MVGGAGFKTMIVGVDTKCPKRDSTSEPLGAETDMLGLEEEQEVQQKELAQEAANPAANASVPALDAMMTPVEQEEIGNEAFKDDSRLPTGACAVHLRARRLVRGAQGGAGLEPLDVLLCLALCRERRAAARGLSGELSPSV